jgi:hypothetical protein
LPKSPIGEAIAYALNNWAALVRYTEDGALEIDNNAAERSLRGVAVERNYQSRVIMEGLSSWPGRDAAPRPRLSGRRLGPTTAGGQGCDERWSSRITRA